MIEAIYQALQISVSLRSVFVYQGVGGFRLACIVDSKLTMLQHPAKPSRILLSDHGQALLMLVSEVIFTTSMTEKQSVFNSKLGGGECPLGLLRRK